jgi:hypothetical protein
MAVITRYPAVPEAMVPSCYSATQQVYKAPTNNFDYGQNHPFAVTTTSVSPAKRTHCLGSQIFGVMMVAKQR